MLIAAGALLLVCFTKPDVQSHTKWKFTGIWQYRGITKNDTSFIKVGPNDTMIINSNGSFRYDLEYAGKHASGTWKAMRHKKLSTSTTGLYAIKFFYSTGEKRIFEFCFCSVDSLCIREGNVKFLYSRKKY